MREIQGLGENDRICDRNFNSIFQSSLVYKRQVVLEIIIQSSKFTARLKKEKLHCLLNYCWNLSYSFYKHILHIISKIICFFSIIAKVYIFCYTKTIIRLIVRFMKIFE
jgi:hypothetical protein